MGRGRQKAKQQKIARKLKYLTTDTDYDELAKELSEQEPGTGSPDPFADVDDQYADKDVDSAADAPGRQGHRPPRRRTTSTSTPSGQPKPPQRRPAANSRPPRRPRPSRSRPRASRFQCLCLPRLSPRRAERRSAKCGFSALEQSLIPLCHVWCKGIFMYGI